MKESRINVNLFGSHSTRSASTSKCKMSGLSFKEIAKSAYGQMNKYLRDFVTGQFKRTFQTIDLDEICCF